MKTNKPKLGSCCKKCKKRNSKKGNWFYVCKNSACSCHIKLCHQSKEKDWEVKTEDGSYLTKTNESSWELSDKLPELARCEHEKTMAKNEHCTKCHNFLIFNKAIVDQITHLSNSDWTKFVRTYVTRFCPDLEEWKILSIAGNLEQVVKKMLDEGKVKTIKLITDHIKDCQEKGYENQTIIENLSNQFILESLKQE